MSIPYFMDEADYETIWRAVAALSPSRLHSGFNEFARRYKCLSSPGFVNAQHVVVEGVSSGRISLCPRGFTLFLGRCFLVYKATVLFR